MPNQNTEDTAPTRLQPESNLGETQPLPLNRKSRWWPWIVGGIFFIVLSIALGAGIGYRNAVQSRLQEEVNQVAQAARVQFQLGVEDMDAGRYEIARQRLEYVVQLDPAFPEAAIKLAEVLAKLAITATPIPTHTPTNAITLTPTRDLRPVEEMFNQALDLLNKKEWEKAIRALDALRNADFTYRAVDADGIYYMALRFRGIDKILKEGNLESGMYDLAIAERFGPLDKDADSYRTWARFYVTGASFWGVDWQKVLFYFGQIYPALPYLRDTSNWTSTERFRVASIKYGDQLAEKEDWCAAEKQYENALALGQNATLVPTATKIRSLCAPATATPLPTIATPTVTVTGMVKVTPTGPTLTLTYTRPAITPTPTATSTPASPTPTPTHTATK